MENKNENAAKVIGGIVLGISIFSLMAFIALIIFILLAFRSCNADNNGRKAYTSNYIEDYLESCYNTDFTLVSQEESTVEDKRETQYIYRDTNGVECTVVQKLSYGTFTKYWFATDNYSAAKMFADPKVVEALNDSGYEYVFVSNPDSSYALDKGPYLCKMTARSYEDVSEIAELLYNVAGDYFLEQPDNSKRFGTKSDYFSHQAPSFTVCTPSGESTSFLNVPFTQKGSLPYQSTSKQDYIKKCKEYYVGWAEKEENNEVLPDSAFDDIKRSSYAVYCNGKPIEGMTLDLYSTITNDYIVTQKDCYTRNGNDITYCPLMEILAEIANMSVVPVGDDELDFYSEDETDPSPVMRLYAIESTGSTKRIYLDKDSNTYTYSNRDQYKYANYFTLTVDDIYDLFGIRTEFDNKNSIAELIPPENLKEE